MGWVCLRSESVVCLFPRMSFVHSQSSILLVVVTDRCDLHPFLSPGRSIPIDGQLCCSVLGVFVLGFSHAN